MGFKYNSLIIGLISGLLIPFVGFAILLTVYDQLDGAGWLSSDGFSISFRRRTIAMLAICLNLIPMTYFQKNRATQSIRGLVLMTIIMAGLWLFYYGSEVLS